MTAAASPIDAQALPDGMKPSGDAGQGCDPVVVAPSASYNPGEGRGVTGNAPRQRIPKAGGARRASGDPAGGDLHDLAARDAAGLELGGRLGVGRLVSLNRIGGR